MSNFGYSAGELDRLESRLDGLVQAMLIFDAARLGAAGKFGFGLTAIEAARAALSDFAEQLRVGLNGGGVAPDYSTLLEDIRKGDLPVADWQADLEGLPQRLLAGELITDQQSKALQRAISFFRQEVAERANRIRNR
jgi:hypothetical protein